MPNIGNNALGQDEQAEIPELPEDTSAGVIDPETGKPFIQCIVCEDTGMENVLNEAREIIGEIKCTHCNGYRNQKTLKGKMEKIS